MRQPNVLLEQFEDQSLETIFEHLGIDQPLLDHYLAERQPLANVNDLNIFPMAGFEQILVTPLCAEAAEAMILTARQDNVTIYPISGFRTLAYQAMLIQRKLDRGEPLAQIMRVNALPGYSEHHTGEALDLGTTTETDLETAFEETSAFDWLGRHAQSFGFTLSYPRGNPQGFIYEPWHWRFTKP